MGDSYHGCIADKSAAAVWSKITEKFFQLVVESVPHRILAALKAKVSRMQY